jgi:molecular chaperone GrpE
MRDALKAAKDEQLRLLAEMDNQRKRLQRDVDAARRYGAERLLSGPLPVARQPGARPGRGQRRPGAPARRRRAHAAGSCRRRWRTRASRPRPVGQPFDPEQHQAMSVVETSQYDPAPSPA